MKIVHRTILVDKIDDLESKEFIEQVQNQVIKSIKNLRMPNTADGFYFNPKSKSYNVNNKKKGGNGVKPIKDPFVNDLIKRGWISEFPSDASDEGIAKIKVIQNWGKSKNCIYGRVKSINRVENKIVISNRKGTEEGHSLSIDLECPLEDEKLIGELVSLSTSKPGALDACINVGDKLFGVEWETGNVSSSHRALNKMALLLLNGHLTGGVLIVPTRKMYRYLTDRIGNYEELSPYFKLWRNINIEKGYLEIISIEHDGLNDESPIIAKGNDGNASRPVITKS